MFVRVSPSYTDKNTKVDSETVYLWQLTMGLIVPLRPWTLSMASH